MKLTKMVEVDDARVAALTPEAFRLVLEARGWAPAERGQWREPGQGRRAWWHVNSALLHPLSQLHHNGSTYDAFIEVERVQALLEAVEAAGRGVLSGYGAMQGFRGVAGGAVVRVTSDGCVFVGDARVSRLWVGAGSAAVERNPARAAREARAQLPRLVRIICGVEASDA